MESIACEDFRVTYEAYILREKLYGGWEIKEVRVLSSNKHYVRVGWLEDGEVQNRNFYRYFGVNNEGYLRECGEGFLKLFLTKRDAIEYTEYVESVERANKENEQWCNDKGEYNDTREEKPRDREAGRGSNSEVAFEMLRRQRISAECLESLMAEIEERLDKNGREMSNQEALIGLMLLQMAYELQERRQEDEEEKGQRRKRAKKGKRTKAIKGRAGIQREKNGE